MSHRYYAYVIEDLVPGGRYKPGQVVEVASYSCDGTTFIAKVVRLKDDPYGGAHPDDTKYHWYLVAPYPNQDNASTHIHDRNILRVMTVLDDLAAL